MEAPVLLEPPGGTTHSRSDSRTVSATAMLRVRTLKVPLSTLACTALRTMFLGITSGMHEVCTGLWPSRGFGLVLLVFGILDTVFLCGPSLVHCSRWNSRRKAKCAQLNVSVVGFGLVLFAFGTGLDCNEHRIWQFLVQCLGSQLSQTSQCGEVCTVHASVACWLCVRTWFPVLVSGRHWFKVWAD